MFIQNGLSGPAIMFANDLGLSTLGQESRQSVRFRLSELPLFSPPTPKNKLQAVGRYEKSHLKDSWQVGEFSLKGSCGSSWKWVEHR